MNLLLELGRCEPAVYFPGPKVKEAERSGPGLVGGEGGRRAESLRKTQLPESVVRRTAYTLPEALHVRLIIIPDPPISPSGPRDGPICSRFRAAGALRRPPRVLARRRLARPHRRRRNRDGGELVEEVTVRPVLCPLARKGAVSPFRVQSPAGTARAGARLRPGGISAVGAMPIRSTSAPGAPALGGTLYGSRTARRCRRGSEMIA